METSTNQARKSPDVRAALKEQQQARLAAKAKMAAGDIPAEQYSAMYSKQPVQVERAKKQQANALLRQAARTSAVSAGVNNAKGGATAFLTDGGAE